MTSLVFTHITQIPHFLKTNVALKFLHRLDRMPALQVTSHITNPFVTYRTNLHIFEVDNHVSQNKVLFPVLKVAEGTKVCMGSNLLSVNFNIGHGSFHYFFVNINYCRVLASLTIKF